jgi:NADPH2:quinone reductase
MKALVVAEHGPLESLKLGELPDPVVKPGEVLVDIKAASVNFPDLLVIAGTYQKLPQRPFAPGKDFSGVVAAVGAGVDDLKPGDRVMAQAEYGAYATQAAVPAGQCSVMPDRMSFAEAAAIGLVYTTAHLALVERAGLKAGDKVLVNGAAGGVGLAAVQLAKAKGATVVASVSTEEKAKIAREAGADFVVRTDVPDLRESFRKQVFEAVGPKGVDIIVDPVGGDVFDASLRAIGWGGRLVIVGFAAGRIPEVKAGLLLVKNISLIGLQASDYRDRDKAKLRAVHRDIFALYEAGQVKPLIMGTFPLAQYQEALRIVQARKVLGKVVIMISDET